MGALANLKDRPAGVEGVASQTEAGLRKIFLQIGRQPAKGLEFTVLFDLFIIAEGRVLARLSILNKFGGERQSQPGRLDQLGLQHRMQISGAGFMLAHQAMRTMLFFKDQKPGSIHGHGESPFQAGKIQDLVADQAAHALGAQIGKGRGTDMAQIMA